MQADGSVETIKVRVKELLADIVDVEPAEIPEDAPLFDAGFAWDGLDIDSLDALKLAVALANEYDLDEAAGLDYAELRTVTEIAEYVQRLLRAGGEA